MTFHHQTARKLTQIAALCAVTLGVTGCVSYGTPTSTVDNGADVPSYVRNLPKSKTGNMAHYTVFGKRYQTLDSAANFSERGTASWYGKKFHGRKTSSGATYDMYAMTAAHKHLPLPTYVRVTNLENNKSVIVLVNDRGPFVGSRVIDLSFAAAMEIEMAEQGTAKVRVDALSTHYIDGDAPVNTNIADTTVPNTQGVELVPSVIEPELAAVPLQEPLESEAVIPEPAAALASEPPIVAADTMQRGVEVDGSEDGFVEVLTLDAAPQVAEPSVVQNFAQPATPNVVTETTAAGGNVFIQLGAFSQIDNAGVMVARISDRVGLPAFVEHDTSRRLYRVKMGPFKKGPMLDKTLSELESVGIESYTLLASTR